MSNVITRDLYGKTYTVDSAQLQWRPAAYAVIVRDSRVLLVKERGKYHMIGGGVELGETPEDAVVREVKEESGLIVVSPRLADTITTFFAWTDRAGRIHHMQSLLLYYTCEYKAGAINHDGRDEYELEKDQLAEWVPIEALDSIEVGTTVDWRPIVKRATRA